MPIGRELAPEEVAEIAALAAEFKDLREIRPLVASLKQRNEELAGIKLDSVMIHPQSTKDLIALVQSGLVTKAWAQARLPENGEAKAVASSEKTTPHKAEETPRPYVVKDKRGSAA